MGNHSAVGHTMNMCWCTDALGFEHSAKALINLHGIEPWNARDLIRENLRKQGELARRSPLQKIPVEDGLKYISQKVRGFFATTLSREQFAKTCLDLMMVQKVAHTPKDRDELFEIFDSMDFDKSGSLSLGEWAGGLSVFFKGDTEACVHAVFNALDGDKSATLTKRELQEYLTPFVKAMSPPTADALRPLLLKKAVDDIYKEMDLDHQGDISSSEMLEWTKRGNNIVDRLADIIDKEVYSIWLAENHKRITREKLAGTNDSRNGPATGSSKDAQFEDLQYGGAPDEQYGGGSPNQQCGGVSPNQQYGGGSPNQQYGGGPPNQQYGGGSPNQSQQYGGPPNQYGMGSTAGPGYDGGFNSQAQAPGGWGGPTSGPLQSTNNWGGPPGQSQGPGDWGGPSGGAPNSRDGSSGWQSPGSNGWDRRQPQYPNGFDGPNPTHGNSPNGWDRSPGGYPENFGPPCQSGQGMGWGGPPSGPPQGPPGRQPQDWPQQRGVSQDLLQPTSPGGYSPVGYQDGRPQQYPSMGPPPVQSHDPFQTHDNWNVPPPPPPPRRGGPPGQSSYGGPPAGGGGYGAPPPPPGARDPLPSQAGGGYGAAPAQLSSGYGYGVPAPRGNSGGGSSPAYQSSAPYGGPEGYGMGAGAYLGGGGGGYGSYGYGGY